MDARDIELRATLNSVSATKAWQRAIEKAARDARQAWPDERKQEQENAAWRLAIAEFEKLMCP